MGNWLAAKKILKLHFFHQKINSRCIKDIKMQKIQDLEIEWEKHGPDLSIFLTEISKIGKDKIQETIFF